MTDARTGCVDLWWLPLGAGGHVVRLNGRVYEALVARREHRPALDLYHSALEVTVDGTRHVVEVAPVWSGDRTADRGVTCSGPVGLRVLGRSALFRYEVRCWAGGSIPDADAAVDSPLRLSEDAARAARVLRLVPQLPALTWGRDELRAGEMWNSNSVVSWLLARSGHDPASVALPRGGRAPGWAAGLVAAARGTPSPVAAGA